MDSYSDNGDGDELFERKRDLFEFKYNNSQFRKPTKHAYGYQAGLKLGNAI